MMRLLFENSRERVEKRLTHQWVCLWGCYLILHPETLLCGQYLSAGGRYSARAETPRRSPPEKQSNKGDMMRTRNSLLWFKSLTIYEVQGFKLRFNSLILHEAFVWYNSFYSVLVDVSLMFNVALPDFFFDYYSALLIVFIFFFQH